MYTEIAVRDEKTDAHLFELERRHSDQIYNIY